MDGEEGNKEITFIYTKPRLLLHYDFNDESISIVKDKSGNGHTGNIIGNIYRDDR